MFHHEEAATGGTRRHFEEDRAEAQGASMAVEIFVVSNDVEGNRGRRCRRLSESLRSEEVLHSGSGRDRGD